MSTRMFEQEVNVLVIGGGVIGAACALELAERGVGVTLIDKGLMGHGCSYGNAGWITPSFAMPLPMPGMLLKSAGWLLDPESPLYIKPRCSMDLCRWLLRFLASTTTAKMNRSTRALVELASYSRDAYGRLNEAAPGAFDFQEHGTLVVASTPRGMKDALHHKELVEQFGIEGSAMSADEVQRLEPAIAASIQGGVFYPRDAHAEPLATVQAMLRRAEALGAKIIPGVEAFDFHCENGKVKAVETTHGLIRADRIVLATGAWSKPLGRKVGLRIPMLSGKGYAVTVETWSSGPTRPIEWLEKRVVITPHAARLRIAGTLELVDLDDTITTRRVDSLVRTARELLNLSDRSAVLETWRGLRPCTPDGVPIIDRAPRWDNLYLVVGHQMLGLMTAPASARLLADLVTETTPGFDPGPFRTSRF